MTLTIPCGYDAGCGNVLTLQIVSQLRSEIEKKIHEAGWLMIGNDDKTCSICPVCTPAALKRIEGTSEIVAAASPHEYRQETRRTRESTEPQPKSASKP